VAEPAKDGKGGFLARQRPVSLGRIQGSSYQVLKGLEPGEQIITSGIQLLADGAPVKPNRSGS
jgi:multidrug efflux pump subunit AcrA (membrane-fusion protein)